MSNYASFPAEGIQHLIIEEAARDAQVRGSADATTIQVLAGSGAKPGGPEFVAEGDVLRLSGAPASRVFLPAGIAVTVKTAAGDLRVQELAGEVNLEAVHGDLRLSELSGIVRLAAVSGDLRAEGVADLRLLGSADGDIRFENSGDLDAEMVTGDARIYNARAVRLNRLRGDLWVEKLSGALQLTRADGDARLSQVAGPVKLQTLSGDLRADGLSGGLAAGKVAGDVSLFGPFTSDEGYVVAAAGDVSLHLPADADLRLTVQATGRIRSDVRLIPAADGSPNFTATLGQGTRRLTVSCSGDLRITQAGAEGAATTDTDVRRAWREARTASRAAADRWTDLGERIRQQVTSSLAAAGINIETGEIDWSQRDHYRGFRGVRPTPPPAPERPKPPTPPPGPSTEEQAAILKMVEDGTITAAEAEKLLKALGA